LPPERLNMTPAEPPPTRGFTMTADQNAIKRLVVFGLGALFVLLKKKIGLDISETDTEVIATMVMTYVLQSSWKEATVAKASAASDVAKASIQNADDAVKVLNAEGK
jgi:hypothetical protein